MLQILAAFLLVLFLPGFTLVNLLFPRRGELDREYDLLYRITLGIVMSIVVLVLFGFVLNALGVNPETGLGYFTAPNLWVGLSALTAVFFLAGWWRGAYPSMGRLHPSLARLPPREAASILGDFEGDRKVMLRFRELAGERETLRRAMKDAERRVALHTGSMREHYEGKLREIREKLRGVDEAIRELEERQAQRLT